MGLGFNMGGGLLRIQPEGQCTPIAPIPSYHPMFPLKGFKV